VTTFKEFGARSAHFGQNGDWDESRGARVFFVWKTTRPFENFATADFHQIWSRNVVRCPVDEFRKTFSKIFTLRVICAKNLKSKLGQTGTSLRAGYRSREALQRDTVYSACRPKAMEFQGLDNFLLYDVRLRSYGASKLTNFRILAYFPHTKPLIRTFR